MIHLTAKERILLHLFEFAKYGEAIEVPPAMTQEGIAHASGIDVPHFTQYVRPLVREGLVRERMAHVKGVQRRRKVYDLTDTGKLSAIRLRDKSKSETVRVRDADGVREATLAQVLERIGGKASILAIHRQMEAQGIVDLATLVVPTRASFVEALLEMPRLRTFAGRGKELEEITAEGGPQVIIVRGVAGVGKSSLAAKACELLRGKRNLFWHRVRPWDTSASILADVGDFLFPLGKPGLRSVLARGDTSKAAQVLREDLPGTLSFLVFDDAHEARPEALPFFRLLKEVIAEATDVRALVLTRQTVPFYDRRDVAIGRVVREIDLAGLEPEDIASLAPAGTDSEAFVRFGRQLGGHPLFLELLLAQPVAPSGAIGDVRRFIEEEIYAKLSSAERRIMKTASLYRVPVPDTALFFESESHDALMTMMDRSLIRRLGDNCVGVHDTIREFFESVVTPPERLELAEFAAGQLRQLAAEARESGNFVASINYLSNALRLCPQAEQPPSLWEALGEAHDQIGDLPETLAAYKEALSRTEQRDVVARLHRKMASALIDGGEFTQALAEMEEGFRALGTTMGVERGWLELLRCRVAVASLEFEEARDSGEEALRTFEMLGDLRGRAATLVELAYAEAHAPKANPSLAEEYLGLALNLSGPISDPKFTAEVRSAMAHFFAYHRPREAEQAMVHIAAMEALPEALRDPHVRLSLLMLKAWFNLDFQADFPAAEAQFSEALDVARKIYDTPAVLSAKAGLAYVSYFRGKIAEARLDFEQLATVTDVKGRLRITTPGRLPFGIEIPWTIAECCLLQDDLEGFGRTVAALDDPKLVHGVDSEILGNILRGIDCLIKGDRKGSDEAFGEAVQIADEGFAIQEAPWVYHAEFAHFYYGVALRVMGRDREAEKHIRRTEEIVQTCHLKAMLAVMPKRERRLTEVLRRASKTS